MEEPLVEVLVRKDQECECHEQLLCFDELEEVKNLQKLDEFLE